MAKRKGLTEYRDVNVRINPTVDTGVHVGEPAPVDFYKAVMVKVEELEGLYADGTAPADYSSATVILRGASPNIVHRATLTTTLANAEYTFDYDTSAANPDLLP